MVYLIENADEICEKFKPNTNILRGKLLRKQLRGRPGRGEIAQSQVSDRTAWPPGRVLPSLRQFLPVGFPCQGVPARGETTGALLTIRYRYR